MNKFAIFGSIMVIVAIAVVAVIRVQHAADPLPAASAAAEAVPPAPTAETTSSAPIKEFTIVGKNYLFSPSAITVHRGDRVKITFRDDQGFHDLVIRGLNVATKRIRMGDTSIVEFTADKTGTFEYYCSVGNHREEGMRGTLTIQ